MKHVYVTANLNLFDDNMLYGTDFKDHNDRNQRIIENWNAAITPEDWVIITSNISDEEDRREEIKKILGQLNGDKYLLYSIKDSAFSPEGWQSLGVKLCFNCPVSHTTKQSTRIVLTSDCCHNKEEDGVQMLSGGSVKYYGSELYKDDNPSVDLFCQGTTNYFNKRYDNRILNVDINKWDYTPILCENLMSIYTQMKMYE